MKKILTLLLSAVTVLAMMPGLAFAETLENCPGDETCTHVASIGTTHYDTLQDAIDATQSAGTEIKMIGNAVENVKIINGKSIVIDLNGFTLSGGTTANVATIENEGTLAIKDSTGKGIVERGDKGNPSYYVVENNGVMNIEGGNFTNDSGYTDKWAGSSLICNGPTKVAQLTISGGTFTQPNFIVIKNDDYGTLNITDGVFTTEGSGSSAVQNWNNAIISGGVFNGPIFTSVWKNDNVSRSTTINGNAVVNGIVFMSQYYQNMTAKPTVNISNGIFNATPIVVIESGDEAIVNINGGAFVSDPKDYVIDGFKSVDNGTKFNVVPIAESVTVTPNVVELNVGDAKTLTVGFNPVESEGPVTWETDNNAVATVDVNGKVTAVKEGTATITATVDGHSASCTVTVKAKSTGGGSVTPSVPSDPITNTGTSDTDNATTNADISKDTTSKTETATETKPDGTTSTTTTTTVSKETADKIVDKAVEHQSAEVVVDTTTGSAVPVAGDKTEVKLPAETMQALAEKTTADVTIKSDVAEVTLDAKAVDAVAEQVAETKAETVTLVVENTKNDAEEMRFELELVTESGKVYDFDGGNVSVTVKLNKSLQAVEKLVCVYIDDNGVMSKVEGYKNADGTFTFVTGHFSTYAIMAEDEADKLIEEQTNARLKAGVENTTLKLKSTLDGKGIKLNWTKSKGYKVDYYEVYKSLNKSKGYGTKPYYETKDGSKTWYKNTKELKKGTRYYYKVRGVRVINGEKVYTQYSTKAWRLVK